MKTAEFALLGVGQAVPPRDIAEFAGELLRRYPQTKLEIDRFFRTTLRREMPHLERQEYLSILEELKLEGKLSIEERTVPSFFVTLPKPLQPGPESRQKLTSISPAD